MNQIDRTKGPKLLGGDAAGMMALADDHRLHGFAPVNIVDGRGAYAAELLDPLRAAFPRGEERCDIRLFGHYKDGDWIASSGHIAGLFEADLFGIPATGRTAMVRFGRFERHEGGKIAETILILDLPALMMQAGCWPCGPAMGAKFPRARPHYP